MMAKRLEELISEGVIALGGYFEGRAEQGEIKDLNYQLLARHFISSLFIYFMTYGRNCNKKEHNVYLKTVIQALCDGIIKK